MSKALSALVLSVVLCGCAPMVQQTPISRIPFPEREYVRLPTTGTAVVRGQVFLRTRGGDVKTCAGNEVLLNPVTSYSDEWYSINYEGGRPLAPADPRLFQYVRKQTADADGRFTFTAVPPGDYYLGSTVVWEAPTGYGGSLRRQGGYVVKRISVSEGAVLDVVVTR